MRGLVFIAAVAAAACGQMSSGKGPDAAERGASAEDAAASATATTPESDLLRVVAMYESYEAQAAALAAERAQAPPVRDFAAARAAGRDTAMAAIAEGAAAAQVAAPDGALDADRQAYVEMLRNAQPGQFDALYASQQTLMHMATIGALQNYAAAHPQSALTPWANARQAELQTNLVAARALAR